MANQTLTTTANYDEAALTGLANGETITINAGTKTRAIWRASSSTGRTG
jgi:hypothetical protein